MSAYRTEAYVADAIRSCLTQALPIGWEIEVIVGVDACRGTLEAAKATADDPRVRIIEMRRNVGTYQVLNTLLDRSTGDVIAILDSDDLMRPGRLKAQVTALLSGEDFVASRYDIESDGRVSMGPGINSRISFASLAHPLHSTWCCRRWVYERLGGYQPWRCGADTDFFVRVLALQLRLLVLQSVLTRRRVRPGQLTAEGTATGPGTAARKGAIRRVSQTIAELRTGRMPAPRLASRAAPFISHTGRPRTAALLPTLPRRQRCCQITVRNLLAQGVDLIQLHANGHASVPTWANHPRIQVIRHPAGTGPIVRWSELPDADIIFGVDDDLAYPADYVATTLRHLRWLGRGRVISYHCSHWPPGKKALEDRVILSFADGASIYVPKTYMGSGVSCFFADDLRKLDKCTSKSFERLDDVWISSSVARAGLQIYRPPSPKKWIGVQPEQHEGIYKAEVAERFASRKIAIAEALRLGPWPFTPTHPPLSTP